MNKSEAAMPLAQREEYLDDSSLLYKQHDRHDMNQESYHHEKGRMDHARDYSADEQDGRIDLMSDDSRGTSSDSKESHHDREEKHGSEKQEVKDIRGDGYSEGQPMEVVLDDRIHADGKHGDNSSDHEDKKEESSHHHHDESSKDHHHKSDDKHSSSHDDKKHKDESDHGHAKKHDDDHDSDTSSSSEKYQEDEKLSKESSSEYKGSHRDQIERFANGGDLAAQGGNVPPQDPAAVPIPPQPARGDAPGISPPPPINNNVHVQPQQSARTSGDLGALGKIGISESSASTTLIPQGILLFYLTIMLAVLFHRAMPQSRE